MICVLGVLKTDEGLKIKEELLSWLIPSYEVIAVEQEAPGRLYEYPAIQLAADMAYRTSSDVLYLHTKGAFNRHPVNADIRRMWRNEFGNLLKAKKYYDLVDKDPMKPVIATPIMGPNKETWFNAFVIGQCAAFSVSAGIRPDKDRYVFERVAGVVPLSDVEVVSPYPVKEGRAIFDLMYELSKEN